MKILGIETSCDETAASVVEDGTRILSNLIASQVDIHARYGGIIPEIASRQHLLSIIPVIHSAMTEADVQWEDLDGIAVTLGPGLAGSLLVGVNTAKAIAWAKGLPLIGINHLEGHIHANWLDEEKEQPALPSMCLIISGGHSDLALMEGHGQYLPLGQTRDDAAGEAFDKTARILRLGYPGGPAIEKAAASGDTSAYHLPRAWLKGSDDFSFSGLKTAALRLAENIGIIPAATAEEKHTKSTTTSIANLAAAFQEAVIDVLVTKTINAARRRGFSQILISGGVAANKQLRRAMQKRSPIPVRFPPPKLCTDNAAMIASCGYFHFKAGEISSWDLDAIPNLKLAQRSV